MKRTLALQKQTHCVGMPCDRCLQIIMEGGCYLILRGATEVELVFHDKCFDEFEKVVQDELKGLR